MLAFSKRQLLDLRAPCRRNAAARLAADLRREGPAADSELTEEDFRTTVRIALDDAEGYGLEREIDLRGFALLALLFGAGFHRQSAVQKILNDAEIPTDLKIDHLLGRVSEADWQQAREIGGENAM